MTASNFHQYHFLIVLMGFLQVLVGICHAMGNTGLVCVETKYYHTEIYVHHGLCKNRVSEAVNCGISSLAILPELLQENSTVRFCTTHIHLNTSIHFQGFYNVTFIGDQQMTVIDCSLSHEAGISFTDSEKIHLKNLVFEQCSALQESTSVNVISGTTLQFYTSLYIFHVSEFSMHNVTVRNSSGLGLAMFDVGGLVNIGYCVFKNNNISTPDHDQALGGGGGGGMYVEFTYCPPGRYRGNHSDNRYNYIVNSTYFISHSSFKRNIALKIKQSKSHFYVNDRARFLGFGGGGGLQVILGKSARNTITVSNCNFIMNKAFWGGEFKVSIQDEAKYNTLTVLNSTFHRNKCNANGGGAILGYTFYH